MELKRGRLIDHVHLRSPDLETAKTFYKAVFEALGIPFNEEETHLWADEFWIDAGERPTRVHLAFQAPDQETVRRFNAVGLRAGGRDNGEPGGRRKYHPGYYAAFLFDPGGNTTLATTPPSCSIPTATISRRSITGRRSDPPTP